MVSLLDFITDNIQDVSAQAVGGSDLLVPGEHSDPLGYMPLYGFLITLRQSSRTR